MSERNIEARRIEADGGGRLLHPSRRGDPRRTEREAARRRRADDASAARSGAVEVLRDDLAGG